MIFCSVFHTSTIHHKVLGKKQAPPMAAGRSDPPNYDWITDDRPALLE